jgi:hypothetical protein
MNKLLLLISLSLLPAGLSYGQTIAVNSTDRKTGNTLVLTSNTRHEEMKMDDSVVYDGAVFFAVGCNKIKDAGKAIESYFIELDLVHNDNRLGCLDERTGRAELHLEDGSVVECFQISPSDCDRTAFKGAYALMKRGEKPEVTKANLDKLTTTAIKKIIVYTSEKRLEFNVKPREKDYLKKHFALIAKTMGS